MEFSVFKPLAPSVWGVTIATGIVVWLFLWMMNRYNPYEFGERKRRNLATEEEAELFNPAGSFWFMFTLFQWQGYDRSPRSVASKTLSCFWMVFVTLFLIVYTGSYLNQLFWASTMQGQDPTKHPITSLEDLVQRKDGFNYGTTRSGATYNYLTQVAKGEEFEEIKSYFKKNPKYMVDSFDQGVAKVREGNYGFICEYMMARYIMNTRPCDLTLVGNFAQRSYGLAVPMNSPLLEKLHAIILEMTENGDLQELEEKWFEYKGECWNTTIITKLVSQVSKLFVNKPKIVSLKMFWSPIVIMIVGIIFSVVVAVAEILWYKYRGRYSASNRQRTQQLNNDDDVHI